MGVHRALLLAVLALGRVAIAIAIAVAISVSISISVARVAISISISISIAIAVARVAVAIAVAVARLGFGDLGRRRHIIAPARAERQRSAIDEQRNMDERETAHASSVSRQRASAKARAEFTAVRPVAVR
jgi:hypothetical protein